VRKRPVIALVLLAVLSGAAQFVPVRRTNPPVAAPIRTPADIGAVLNRCCSDCHTNQTRWRWYAHIAPASWLVARDVNVGRDNLDFSYWGQLQAADQRQLAKAIVRQVTARKMPPLQYWIVHPKARPTASETEQLRAWFNSNEATPGPMDASPDLPDGSYGGDWGVGDERSR
jgi:hypothetical protein